MKNYWKLKRSWVCICLTLIVFFGCGGSEEPDPQPTDPPTVSPDSGPVGTVVSITGTNFRTTPGNNQVKFNGTNATVNSASSTTLEVVVPDGATTGNVMVTVAEKSATGPIFTVEPDNSSAIVYDCANSDITGNTT